MSMMPVNTTVLVPKREETLDIRVQPRTRHAEAPDAGLRRHAAEAPDAGLRRRGQEAPDAGLARACASGRGGAGSGFTRGRSWS